MVYKIFALILMIFLSGCSFNKVAPKEYTLSLVHTAHNSKVQGCKDKTLKVKNVFGSSDIMSERMSYAMGDLEYYHYSQARWQEAPAEILTQKILEHLRDTDIFKEVIAPSSRAKGEWLFETNILRFVQKFDHNAQNSKVELKMHLSIVDRRDETIVSSKTLTLFLDAPSDDAHGGVEALNAVLQKGLQQQQEWLEGVCQ